ncbi:hypothetical protein D046_4930B, partial [Vibrio parahaemolyticus V-223/04]
VFGITQTFLKTSKATSMPSKHSTTAISCATTQAHRVWHVRKSAHKTAWC